MFRSKVIAALAATTALGVSAASAADLAARPYTKAPAYIDSIYNWSGFYVGGHIGGASTNEQWINSANTTLFAQWTINTYTVSFTTQGGSAVSSQTVNYGANATQPAAPSPSAIGWRKNLSLAPS